MTVHEQKMKDEFWVGGIVASGFDGETKDEEEMDIVDIIEELPDESGDQFEADPIVANSKKEQGEDPISRRSTHEFSLSSIGSALAGTLHASTATLGSATASLHSKSVEKLRQSFSHIQASPRDLGSVSHHGSNHGRSSIIRAKFGQRQPVRKVDFGPFEARAVRLQYTQDDIFDIADDPLQFDGLRQALRSLGAITNNVLKQKLHWYVKNSKRARKEEEERQRYEEEEDRIRQEEYRRQQEECKAPEREVEPITPPTAEYKVIDRDEILKAGAGVINPEDPSPKSVRGIFVPPS